MMTLMSSNVNIETGCKKPHPHDIKHNCLFIERRVYEARYLLDAIRELAQTVRNMEYEYETKKETEIKQGLTLEDMASLAKDYAQSIYEMSGLIRSEIMLENDPTDVSKKQQEEAT